MNGQMFLLHARARQLPMMVIGITIAVFFANWVGDLLPTLRLPEERTARVPVTTLAPLAVAMLVSPILMSPTLIRPALIRPNRGIEHTMPMRWRRRRFIHLLLATALCAGALTLAGLDRSFAFGAAEFVRNTLGCVGLVVIATIALGIRLSWAPAFAYLAITFAVAPSARQASSIDHLWAWPMYSSTTMLSAVAALSISFCGLLIYMAAVSTLRQSASARRGSA